MNEPINILDHFSGLFADLEKRMNGATGSLLHTLQKQSIEKLHAIGFPDKKHEDWKYTPVQRLIEQPYHLAETTDQPDVNDIPGLSSIVINIVNGKLVMNVAIQQLKAVGIGVKMLTEALHDTTWTEKFSELRSDVKSHDQPFQLLNFALQSGAFVLDIPANTILEQPIEIRVVHHDHKLAVSNPLYFVNAGKGCKVTIIERYESAINQSTPVSPGLINSAINIWAAPASSIQWIKWQSLAEQQNLVYRLKISQHRDSRFNYFAFDKGGQTVRNNVDADLLESNTYTSMQAGFIAMRKQSIDHQTMINHAVPHCESHELFKGIITDQASAAFNGKVFVRPDAQKTNAFQQNDTLVLSPHAVMNSKPQLEIFADDVKCSHGATIGQLNESALFYLRSRGLDTASATQVLKSAFLSQVIDEIPLAPLREHILKEMHAD